MELGARAFDLLLVLVEQHGRLVTKSTLIERVWPRLVVDENNLPAQIASLRRVLGAGAIRTVPGYGYRLELQVSSADAPAQATSTERLEPPPENLPRRSWPQRLGPLIGRDEDVHRVREALDRSSVVTLVGMSGVGKTRLAQEILARETERPGSLVAWVALESLEDSQHVASAIALAVGVSLPDGVDAFAALRQALEQVPALLILDCAEHLGERLAAPLAQLIAQTQSVRALVTSQAPLGIAGETVYRLSVLPVPAEDTPQDEAARYAAVELFARRVEAADQHFKLSGVNTPLVAEICRRLDGIPLALELAAARVPALGLSGLLDRLDDRFKLLKTAGRSDPRHGALHAAFDWSYGLLTAPEQRVFNRLGTFASTFSLNAAARCVADQDIDTSEAIDLIGRLVDRSLVTVLAADPPRYALLETARQYAIVKLALQGELQAARARMAAAMLDLLDTAHEEYWSLDDAIWLHRYVPELDNVRAALDWATANDSALGVALFGSAWPLFVETDLYAEGRARYAKMLALLSDSLPRARTGRFWEAVATYDTSRPGERARYAAELAASMHSTTEHPRSHYYALMQLALNWRADAPAAQAAFEAGRRLEEPLWPARLLAHGALTEGTLLVGAGRFVEARAAYQRAVRLALTTSERQALAATVNLVELDIACGDTRAALQLGRPLAVSLHHMGRRETRFELLGLIFSALLLNGELDEAHSTGCELYALAVQLDPGKLFAVLDAMAFLACTEQRHDDARRIASSAEATHQSRGLPGRRPAEERMLNAVATRLEAEFGRDWRSGPDGTPGCLDPAAACALALRLSA